MKNKILLISSIAVLIFSSACAKKEEKNIKANSGNLKDLPAWVLDPAVPNGIAGVGIANPSKGGIKFQIPKAELDAKANIAATIQSEISRITKDSMRSANVNGVKRINIFKSEDGTLYVHMLLSNEDYSKFLADSQKSFSAQLAKSNVARENIAKTQEASKELFSELETERGSKPVANEKTAQ